MNARCETFKPRVFLYWECPNCNERNLATGTQLKEYVHTCILICPECGNMLVKNIEGTLSDQTTPWGGTFKGCIIDSELPRRLRKVYPFLRAEMNGNPV